MKIKNILCLACCSLVLSACDPTDITPLDSITDATYWTKPEDLKLYANTLYDKLPEPKAHKDADTDNMLQTNYSPWLFNEFTRPTSSNKENNIWYWENIRNCNYFLTRYQKVVGSEAEINQYVAEVRFFRAMDYQEKIMSYGDVPWYDKDLQTTDKEELYKARDPRDLVLQKIVEDYEYAIKWLPEPEDAKEDKKGRLHKDAVRTQLARLYLDEGTLKKYHNISGTPSADELLKKAAEVAKTIMDTKRYEIVRGSDAGASQMPFDGYPLYYCNQFVQEDLTSNKEAVMARYYVQDVLTHQLGRTAGESGHGFSKDFIESFLCKDGLPKSLSPTYQGDGYIEYEIKNRDPRLYQMVDNLNRPYKIENGVRTTNPYPSVSPSSSVTGYHSVKFRSPNPMQAEAKKCSYDWFIYRYAEVLLIYAEAKAELGECTQTVLDESINLLRDRVGMPHLTVSPVADPEAIDYGYSVSPLLYEIRRERRIELAEDGFRRNDIVRWKAGKLLENPKTYLGIRVTDKVVSIYPKGTFGGEEGRQLIEYKGNQYLRPYAKSLDDAGRKWSDNDKRYLKPLPTDELVLNPNLKQNPGW